jgi:hypothetical protein
MPGRPWRRPSHATIVAYLALFVALGGSAYAATSLPAGSVGATQIRAGAVTGGKLAKGAVTGRAVADHSLTGLQIDVSKLGSVPAAAHSTTADRAGTATTAGHTTTADHAGTADQATTAGSAANAVHANNADHATSADQAAIAGHASDSDLLGGAPPASYQTVCPAGMANAFGLCIEPGTRAAATWESAMSSCEAANRRLPSVSELALAFNNLGAAQPTEWTSNIYVNTGAFAVVLMDQDTSRSIGYSAHGDQTPTAVYRCVSTPTTG